MALGHLPLTCSAPRLTLLLPQLRSAQGVLGRLRRLVRVLPALYIDSRGYVSRVAQQ